MKRGTGRADGSAAHAGLVDEGGADHDCEIGGAADGKVPERPRVDATRPALLEAINEGHGAYLWRAGHRPGRKGGANGRECIGGGREVGCYGGHELVDRRKRLDGEERRDFNRADCTYSREVIPQEVRDHQVLGALLH